MNDYQYHYLFASPVKKKYCQFFLRYIIAINPFTSFLFFCCFLFLNDWVEKDLETFDLEDFKYNFVNISAFRIVNADSNFTRHLLKDMEKFQPVGQSILNKSNIIQVCFHPSAKQFTPSLYLFSSLPQFVQLFLFRLILKLSSWSIKYRQSQLWSTTA